MSTLVGGLIQNFEAAYKFMVLITRDSPIGLWSFFSALIMPAVLGAWLRRILPPIPEFANWRALGIEMSMLASGIAVAYLPWPTLHGLLIGLICGFASTMFWKGAAAVMIPLWTWVKRRLGVDDVKLVERDLDIHWNSLTASQKSATISNVALAPGQPL